MISVDKDHIEVLSARVDRVASIVGLLATHSDVRHEVGDALRGVEDALIGIGTALDQTANPRVQA